MSSSQIICSSARTQNAAETHASTLASESRTRGGWHGRLPWRGGFRDVQKHNRLTSAGTRQCSILLGGLFKDLLKEVGINAILPVPSQTMEQHFAARESHELDYMLRHRPHRHSVTHQHVDLSIRESLCSAAQWPFPLCLATLAATHSRRCAVNLHADCFTQVAMIQRNHWHVLFFLALDVMW